MTLTAEQTQTFDVRHPVTGEVVGTYPVHTAEDVIAGRWHGNKAVWIAPEDAGGDLIPFPAEYDHLRAIPVQRAVR